MKTHYRLEIAVQQLHDVQPQEVTSFVAGGCEMVVHFLDFPEISILPQSPPPPFPPGTNGSVPYNTCHAAEFEADAAQIESVLPTQCSCALRHARHIQWSCPCPLSAAKDHDHFRSHTMTNTQSGAVVGYAQMACRVYPVGATQAATAYGTSVIETVAQDQQQHRSLPSHVSSNAGRPYIVRVVVDDSKAKRPPKDAPPTSRGGQAARRSHGGSRAAASSVLAVNTAPANTFLYTLQYDIAYQLQSTSEFLATTLKHDHARLNAAALSSGAKTLTSKIDSSVEQIVRLSNIVLQVANQLIEDNPAPSYTGTTRDVLPSRKDKESATQLKRNPTNKLPTPKEATAAYFLTYHVLFQLQCVGANLFYLTAAYHDALDVSMSTVPKQHAEFCEKLSKEVWKLAHQVNIMIQSAIDGKLGVVSGSQRKKTSADKKKRAKSRGGGASSSSSSPVRSSSSSHSSSSSSSTRSSSSSSSSSSSRSDGNAVVAVPSKGSSILTPLASQPFRPQTSPIPVFSPQAHDPPFSVAAPPSQQQQQVSFAVAAPAPVPVTPPTTTTIGTGPAGAGAEPTPPNQPLSPQPPPIPAPPPAAGATSPSQAAAIPVPVPAPLPTPAALPVPTVSVPAPVAAPPVPAPLPVPLPTPIPFA